MVKTDHLGKYLVRTVRILSVRASSSGRVRGSRPLDQLFIVNKLRHVDPSIDQSIVAEAVLTCKYNHGGCRYAMTTTTWRRFGACNIRMSEYHSILEDAHRTQTVSMLCKYTADPPEGMMMGFVDVVHQRKQLVSVASI